MRGMKIGILGGSFNPPHIGHGHISLVALKRLKLDRVWWVVSPGNPLKSHDGLAPLPQRMKWCKKLSSHPRIEVTDLEQVRKTPYTYETMLYLRDRHPDISFVWLMGADSLVNFHKWKCWEELASLVPMAVIDRPGFRQKAMSSRFAKSGRFHQIKESQAPLLPDYFGGKWAYLTSRQYKISSTEIRNAN
ncbi:MAG: nicotinate-nucleotide adenylyltransferase [Methyloligellaceae bacterium]